MKRFVLIALALVAAACTKQSLQTTYDKQTSNIESFISAQLKSNAAASLVRKDGAYRLTLTQRSASADSLRTGGTVVLYYACYTLTSSSVTNSNLVATNREQIAKAAGWNLSDTGRYKPDTLTLDSHVLPGLAAGLAGVRAQEEGYILFTGKYGYEGRSKGTIPARSALAYHYWIEAISNEN